MGHGSNRAAGFALGAITLLALVVVVWALWPSGPQKARAPRRRRSWRDLIAMLLIAAAAAAAMNALRPAPQRTTDRRSTVELGRQGAQPKDTAPRRRASPTGSLAVSGVAALALLAGTAVVAVRRRRSSASASAADQAADETLFTDGDLPTLPPTTSIADAVLAASRERDPRNAVLLAMAAAELAFAATRHARRRTESPREWSRRANQPALTQLVRVYEIARFSADAVTAADRDAALAALADVAAASVA